MSQDAILEPHSLAISRYGICLFNRGASHLTREQTHKKTHSDEKAFSCPVCNQPFKSKGSIKPHIATKHDGKPKHSCPLGMVGTCKKDFTTIGNMKVNIIPLG